MINTSKVKEALQKAIDAAGSQSALARKIGKPPIFISRIRRNLIGDITGKSWEVLEPFLRPYLDGAPHTDQANKIAEIYDHLPPDLQRELMKAINEILYKAVTKK